MSQRIIKGRVRHLLSLVLFLFAPQLKASEVPLAPIIQEAEAGKYGQLGEQSERLKEAWGQWGQAISIEPQFAFRGDILSIPIPASFITNTSSSCISIAVLATRNNLFAIELISQPEKTTAKSWPVASSVGLSEIRRCGEAKRELNELRLRMRSQRGVFQILALYSHRPPPLASEILKERVAGPQFPAPNIGSSPALESTEVRRLRLMKKLRLQGPEEIRKFVLKAEADGSVDHLLYLAEGCHEIHALPSSSPQPVSDIDAELRELETGEIVALDRGGIIRARMRFCNGRSGRYHLHLLGAKNKEELDVVIAKFPIPMGIPLEWGPISRSRMAATLGAAHRLPIKKLPQLSFLGVSGNTSAASDIIVGHCYALAVSVMMGSASQLNLEVKNGSQYYSSQQLLHEAGTALTFCATQPMMELRISGDGESLNWLFALWDLEPQADELAK